MEGAPEIHWRLTTFGLMSPPSVVRSWNTTMMCAKQGEDRSSPSGCTPESLQQRQQIRSDHAHEHAHSRWGRAWAGSPPSITIVDSEGAMNMPATCNKAQAAPPISKKDRTMLWSMVGRKVAVAVQRLYKAWNRSPHQIQGPGSSCVVLGARSASKHLVVWSPH